MALGPYTTWTLPSCSPVIKWTIVPVSTIVDSTGNKMIEYLSLKEDGMQNHFIGYHHAQGPAMIIGISTGDGKGWYVYGKKFDTKEDCEKYLELKIFW